MTGSIVAVGPCLHLYRPAYVSQELGCTVSSGNTVSVANNDSLMSLQAPTLPDKQPSL